MVDWIESIPISETRNHVQRVLENLQIYRGSAGRKPVFSLASDLARGASSRLPGDPRLPAD
jgi:soluble lytic murein transglycosylase